MYKRRTGLNLIAAKAQFSIQSAFVLPAVLF